MSEKSRDFNAVGLKRDAENDDQEGEFTTLSGDAWDRLQELINAPATERDDDLARLMLGPLKRNQ
ncbi:hypothetical protein [Serratia liquefaciens]|uniref:hypothetical protein n=1 Tax=Serratia liquefaciens TaxID=614 RepID=UPI0021828E24|nr:hypothetical protein [Serratia liquefaciens]CAI2538019.1 Uncharacterised protein [Serratia liquefaciens]